MDYLEDSVLLPPLLFLLTLSDIPYEIAGRIVARKPLTCHFC